MTVGQSKDVFNPHMRGVGPLFTGAIGRNSSAAPNIRARERQDAPKGAEITESSDNAPEKTHGGKKIIESFLHGVGELFGCSNSAAANSVVESYNAASIDEGTTEPRNDALWKDLVGENVFKFIDSEQQLHVKSEAHWYKTFAVDTTPPEFRPEAKIQFKLPFVKLPMEKSAVLGEDVPADLKMEENGQTYVKCFFHPGYLKDEAFLARVKNESLEIEKDSPYLATPTSSYRTLVVAKVDEDGKKDDALDPTQLKVGTPGFVLGANRHLWHEEINQSVANAKMPDVENMEYMHERTGVVGTTDEKIAVPLGFMLRDLPKKDEEYFSFSALFSTEGENPPIILDLMEKYFKDNPDKTAPDFFKTQIIEPFLKTAIDRLKAGYTSEPHSQNLGVTVKDKKVTGFFDRDGGGIYSQHIPEDVAGFDRLPRGMAAECRANQDQKSGYVPTNAKHQIASFFSYYTFRKMINLFTQQTPTSEALDLEKGKAAKAYEFIATSRDLAPRQSGTSRDALVGGQDSILETSPNLGLPQRFRLSSKDADDLVKHVHQTYTDMIEKEFGTLSQADHDNLMGPAVEKGNKKLVTPLPLEKFQPPSSDESDA